MSKIAVVRTGGKQYVVKAKDAIKVEKLGTNVGDQLDLEVLLMAEDDGSKVEVGQPTLTAKAKAKVLEQGRAKKIRVVHYKSKTRQHKVYGHRQPFTKLEIQSL
ncbi:MAG TPA: 50S ribosomal protein L21 [Patescibacteria group bacterium]|nr:50S ribosomal protein L21 [Patescibacteria group bacterium]